MTIIRVAGNLQRPMKVTELMRTATRMVHAHLLARWALMGGLLLILIITLGEVIHFPGILTPPALIPFYIGIAIFTLGAYIIVTVGATRATSRTADSALTQALHAASPHGMDQTPAR